MATTTDLATIEQHIAPEGAALVEQARGFLIVDQASYEAVANHRRLCRAYRSKVAEHLDSIREAQHRAWKLVVAKIDELCAPALQAESIDGKKLATWDEEQARIRNEALAAQARERERLEAEERARIATEMARLRREEEDRRLEAAAHAEVMGDVAAAERIVSAPILVEAPAPRPVFVPPVQVPEAARPEGTSYQTRWSAELINLGELVDGVIGGRVPRAIAIQILSYSGPGANALARATRGNVQVPGVKFVATRITVQR